MTLNHNRRLGGDRRIYVYDAYFPERRKNKERRSGMDRRKANIGRKNGLDRRMNAY